MRLIKWRGGRCWWTSGPREPRHQITFTISNFSFTQCEISEITFSQWISTDRCELLSKSKSKEEFLTDLKNDFPDLAKHDFLATAQADFFQKMKNSVQEDKLIVTLDFAENYTCQVQNAVQSQHSTGLIFKRLCIPM
ncbi:hypothetical protein NQ318_007231 [Aromia moschata]|uniref:Uncharacterized protein n=1 Tax=Aromia moschata TaxID=1265417 RepID=A0AAV8Y6S8_9CUCU|nr:hypothetical protein NQ318_007231 [Aromia moschata]